MADLDEEPHAVALGRAKTTRARWRFQRLNGIGWAPPLIDVLDRWVLEVSLFNRNLGVTCAI